MYYIYQSVDDDIYCFARCVALALAVIVSSIYVHCICQQRTIFYVLITMQKVSAWFQNHLIERRENDMEGRFLYTDSGQNYLDASNFPYVFHINL